MTFKKLFKLKDKSLFWVAGQKQHPDEKPER